MTLQELTSRLQGLCHDGFSLYDVTVVVSNVEHDVGDLRLFLNSEEDSVEVRLGGGK